MESLLLSLGVVVPMAIKMLIGFFLRKAGVIDRAAMRKVDVMCFKGPLAILLFYNIYAADFSTDFDWRIIAFAIAACTAVLIAALAFVPKLERDANRAASIAQAIVRPNFVIFGMTVATAIYGEGKAGTVALLGAVIVPVTTAMAVVVLERNRCGKTNWKTLGVSILKNPMVIAAALAFALRLLPVRFPDMILGAVKDVAGIATTLSFLSLGISLDFSVLRQTGKSLLLGTALRMLAVPLVFMPLAVLLGFRGQALCALTVLFVAPAGISTYPMAVAMGADAELSGELIISTTLVSVVTIFCSILLFSGLGWL